MWCVSADVKVHIYIRAQDLIAAKSDLEKEQQRVKELEGQVTDRDVSACMCALYRCLCFFMIAPSHTSRIDVPFLVLHQ